MKITSETLRRLLTMPEQAMVVALTFLAEQLEADERKRADYRNLTVTKKMRAREAGRILGLI